MKDTAMLTTVLSVPLPSCKPPQAAVAFGMIADVHQDLIPDGMERLQTFISDSKTWKLDFIKVIEFLKVFDAPLAANTGRVAKSWLLSRGHNHILTIADGS